MRKGYEQLNDKDSDGDDEQDRAENWGKEDVTFLPAHEHSKVTMHKLACTDQTISVL